MSEARGRPVPDPHRPVVRVTEGRIRGVRRGPVSVFTRVPYAAPPVGARRFAAPHPPSAHSETRDASSRAPACPQLPSPFAALFGDPVEEQAEDCLTLTVWTPGPDDRRRPVVVWLHGGSYTTGSGTLPRYDGAELAAEQDVVVVLVTYRIGVLGFPPFEDAEPMTLSDDGPDAVPATGGRPVRNVGAWDLLAALQWVRRNAVVFGGDPEGLCAIGQSAGAQILAALLRLPQSVGLVRRAGLHSAPLGLEPVDHETASRAFAAATGTRSARAARRLAVADLLDGQAAVLAEPAARGDVRPGVRLVDDGVLVRGDAPTTLPARPLPLLVATTRDECRLWFGATATVPRGTLHEIVASRFGEARVAEVLDRYGEAGHRGAVAVLAAVMTDAMFGAPNARYADAAGARAPVHLARFDTAARGAAAGYGAAHCIDIPFLLGSPDSRGMSLLTGWARDELADVRGEVRGRWGRFAHGLADRVENDTAAVTLIGGDGRGADGLLHPAVRPLWAEVTT